MSYPYENDRGFCETCQAGSNFDVAENVPSVFPFHIARGSTANVFGSSRPYVTLRVLVCKVCSASIVLLLFRNTKGAVESARRVLPQARPRELSHHVPASIRSHFEEASECENVGALRAAAVMYRAAVEEMCKLQGATGRTLYDRIEALRERLGDEATDDLLHEARKLGNDSIHDGLAYDAEEVADVAELIEEALFVVYVQPEERRAMRSRRDARRAAAKEKHVTED